MFVTSFFEIEKNFELFDSKNKEFIQEQNATKPPRKNLSKINNKFMMSKETLELILQAIKKLEVKVDTKKEIDLLWNEVKQILLSEMNSLPDIPQTDCKKLNRKFRKSKPFWNQELESLWFKTCEAERNYSRFKVHSV